MDVGGLFPLAEPGAGSAEWSLGLGRFVLVWGSYCSQLPEHEWGQIWVP